MHSACFPVPSGGRGHSMSKVNMINYEVKKLERKFDAKTATACFYALRDITQEINAVMQELAKNGLNKAKIQAALKTMPEEDARIIRKLLDTHGKNLQGLAEMLPESGYPGEWTEDMKDFYHNKLARQYRTGHKTILSRYISNSNNIE